MQKTSSLNLGWFSETELLSTKRENVLSYTRRSNVLLKTSCKEKGIYFCENLLFPSEKNF